MVLGSEKELQVTHLQPKDCAMWVGVEFAEVSWDLQGRCEGRTAAFVNFYQHCGLGHICINPEEYSFLV